jgi:hypothetical protein
MCTHEKACPEKTGLTRVCVNLILQALPASCLTSKVELNYYVYKSLETKYKQNGPNFSFPLYMAVYTITDQKTSSLFVRMRLKFYGVHVINLEISHPEIKRRVQFGLPRKSLTYSESDHCSSYIKLIPSATTTMRPNYELCQGCTTSNK